MEERPRHTYLFLGLDFYSVADLAQDIGWSQYLLDPFGGDWDPYWHRLWAWILMRTRDGNKGKAGVRAQVWQQVISASDAVAFIQDDGGAFIFHNLIPYLRPACVAKTGKNWPEQELRKPSIRTCIVEDLRLLRETAVGPIVAYCTKQATVAFLKEAGFPVEEIVCWGARPSVPYRFTPSALYVRRSLLLQTKELSATSAWDRAAQQGGAVATPPHMSHLGIRPKPSKLDISISIFGLPPGSVDKS